MEVGDHEKMYVDAGSTNKNADVKNKSGKTRGVRKTEICRIERGLC